MAVSRITEKLPAQFHEPWWMFVAWAKEEPITFSRGSESQGGYTNYFSLLSTLQTFVPHSCGVGIIRK